MNRSHPSTLVAWEDISDIKHKIRSTLTKSIKLENLAKTFMETAVELRMEITSELDRLDEMINKQEE